MVDKIWYNMEELIGGSEERVLIETYWNVKRNGQGYRWGLRSAGINRNILECKDMFLLILQVESSRSINRNILECKGVNGGSNYIYNQY